MMFNERLRKTIIEGISVLREEPWVRGLANSDSEKAGQYLASSDHHLFFVGTEGLKRKHVPVGLAVLGIHGDSRAPSPYEKMTVLAENLEGHVSVVFLSTPESGQVSFAEIVVRDGGKFTIRAREFRVTGGGGRVDTAGALREMAAAVFSVSSSHPDVYSKLIVDNARLEPSQTSGNMVSMVLACIGAACDDTQAREFYHSTPNPKNAKRIRRGKRPLYEWTTVVIEPKAPRQEHLGGTHASPRLHWCRGHYRALRSGKRVWVKEHLRGDPDLGVIEHAYVVNNVSP